MSMNGGIKITINPSNEKLARKDMVASPRLGSRDEGLDRVVLGSRPEVGQYITRFIELQYDDDAELED